MTAAVAPAVTAAVESPADSTLPAPADPVSAPLREVLALFQDVLAHVKFPDVDAAALAAAAVVVEDKDKDVRRLEAALDEAKRKLDEAQEALLNKAQKAIAYGRVFAIDGDPALMARLDAIALPRSRPKVVLAPTEVPKKKRQKTTADSGLFRVDADSVVALDDAAQ
jgi:hypothetical protein